MSRNSTHLLSIIFAACCISASTAHAQSAQAITLQNGEILPLAQVIFPIHPDGIQPKWPKTKDPRPWCVYAKCLPLDPARVVQILGPNAVHYRVNGQGRGALFMGNTQMSEFAPVRPPKMVADTSLLNKTPVVGLKSGIQPSASTIYWVRVGPK